MSNQKTDQETSDRIREIAAARPPKPKRFYKAATAATVDGGFAVNLDGRTAKTPKREALIVPSRALADAIVVEWEAQVKEIDASTMPLTQLASTAIDGVHEKLDAVLDTLTDYARHDLLCYRVAYPESLVVKQQECWQPILDWAEETLGAKMEWTTGLVAVEQAPTSIQAIRDAFTKLDPWALTAAYTLAGTYKSVLLALAVMKGRISAQDADDAFHLDEEFQNTIWGEDAEAKKRSDKLVSEAIAAETFASLLMAG